jgi:phosphotransferase system HPr (HPr) family protein
MHPTHREVSFLDPNGISVRRASSLVRVAQSFASHIVISCDGVTASLQSLKAANKLPARCTELRLTADGPDAQAAIAALASLILATNTGAPVETTAGWTGNGHPGGTHEPG